MESASELDENYLFRIDIWDTEERQPNTEPKIYVGSCVPLRPSVRFRRNHLMLSDDGIRRRRPVHRSLHELLKSLESFVAQCPGPVQMGRNHPDSTPDTFATLRPVRPSFTFPMTMLEESEPRRPLETYFDVPFAASANPAPVGNRRANAPGNHGRRMDTPHPLTPDEFILRELADIRRLLLQRFLSEGGDLQNLDAHDEIFDILGVLTDEEDEPPPHFPVGEWVWVTCEVCLEFRWLYRRVCCGFPVCSDCLRKYFTTKVTDGIVKIECCNQQCHTFVHRDEVSARLDQQMKLKFHQFLVQANQNPYAKTCPRCSHVLKISKTRNMKNTKNHPERSCVQCAECQLPWCFTCHSPWHIGLTCKQFRKGDRLLKNWAEEMHHGQRNAQRCPKCKVFIQRTSGCDHMHCARCKADFCYRCGDQLRKLKFFGDHYSKLSIFGCKFRYKANQPVQRKFIRGAVFGGKLLVAPVIGTLGACAGVVAMGLGIFALPVYGGIKLYRRYEAQHHPRVPRLSATTGAASVIRDMELPLYFPPSPNYHPNSGSIVLL